MIASLLTNKLYAALMAVALITTHGIAAKVGYDFANRGLEQAVTEALKKQAKTHAERLRAAVKDERKIVDKEQSNANTVQEFEGLGDRSYCPPTADELRILEDIAARTQRE